MGVGQNEHVGKLCEGAALIPSETVWRLGYRRRKRSNAEDASGTQSLNKQHQGSRYPVPRTTNIEYVGTHRRRKTYRQLVYTSPKDRIRRLRATGNGLLVVLDELRDEVGDALVRRAVLARDGNAQRNLQHGPLDEADAEGLSHLAPRVRVIGIYVYMQRKGDRHLCIHATEGRSTSHRG